MGSGYPGNVRVVASADGAIEKTFDFMGMI